MIGVLNESTMNRNRSYNRNSNNNNRNVIMQRQDIPKVPTQLAPLSKLSDV